MTRGIIYLVAALSVIAGCATVPITTERKDAAGQDVKSAEAPPVAATGFFEERNLLLDGVALIHTPERTDAEKARSIFLSLIQRYPQSRWRPAAEAFIRLIDERDSLREKGRQDRLQTDKTEAELTKATQENGNLRKAVRELKEKLQSETAALAQENEQFKRDIQRLKALEIELQKRERMLR